MKRASDGDTKSSKKLISEKWNWRKKISKGGDKGWGKKQRKKRGYNLRANPLHFGTEERGTCGEACGERGCPRELRGGKFIMGF